MGFGDGVESGVRRVPLDGLGVFYVRIFFIGPVPHLIGFVDIANQRSGLHGDGVARTGDGRQARGGRDINCCIGKFGYAAGLIQRRVISDGTDLGADSHREGTFIERAG